MLCLAGLSLLLPGVNMGLGPHLQKARWDLSEDKLYSISPGTLKIIDSLPEPVELILYFSREQAKALVVLRSYAQRVEMLLREYERQSHGRLKLKIIDPAPYSSEEERARDFGLQPLPLGPADTPVYFGLVANSGSKHWQSLPLLSMDEQNFLEYDISRLIQSLHNTQKVGLGVMSSLPINAGFDLHGRQARASWFVMDEIQKAFAVQELSTEATNIAQDLKVLMLVHPKHLSRATLLAIDQFVLRGGRLLVFVDPFSEQDPGDHFFGIPSKDRASNIDTLFSAWGLRLLKGTLVADGEYGQYVNLAHQADPVWQPTAMTLQASAMNQQDVVTSGLAGINLSTVGILEPLEGAHTRFTPLLRSSQSAVAMPTSRLAQLPDPAELARESASAGKRFTLAARIEGPARSAFVKADEASAEALSEAQAIHVIAVADSDLLGDGAWVEHRQQLGKRTVLPWADNGNFVLNALDNLGGSDELISLRSRGRYSRTFTLIEYLQRQARLRLGTMNAELEKRLRDTNQQLAELQHHNSKDDELSPQQQQAIATFTEEKQAIGAQMRETARAYSVEVEELGWLLKALNIAALPVLIGLGLAVRSTLQGLSARNAARR